MLLAVAVALAVLVTVTAAATPLPTDALLPPDDLIDCSNPDFASLPECQGGATPGGTIP